jgi:hypothetical protein
LLFDQQYWMRLQLRRRANWIKISTKNILRHKLVNHFAREIYIIGSDTSDMDTIKWSEFVAQELDSFFACDRPNNVNPQG